jgi:hypothetical protein
MNVELLKKTINEISPETLVEWYMLVQNSSKTMHDKLENYGTSVWQEISQKPLTEDFIRDFQDKVDWEKIACYQNLSERFLTDFKTNPIKIIFKWTKSIKNMS